MKLTVKLDFGGGREVKVGTFSEIARDTAFEFAGDFLSSGLNPAPFRLPLSGGLKIYDRSGNMETFGLFDDSLPDGWGRRIVDKLFMKREGRLPTITERLMCVGRSGKGALVYEPADEAAESANAEFDLAALAEEAMAFDAGEAEDALQRLRKAGGSSGGARPKAYVGYNPTTGEVCAERTALPPGFEHWIVKFNTRRDGDAAGEMEFRYYEAAVAAGADIASSRLVETKAGKFFMTRRFDRTDGGGRVHMASARRAPRARCRAGWRRSSKRVCGERKDAGGHHRLSCEVRGDPSVPGRQWTRRTAFDAQGVPQTRHHAVRHRRRSAEILLPRPRRMAAEPPRTADGCLPYGSRRVQGRHGKSADEGI